VADSIAPVDIALGTRSFAGFSVEIVLDFYPIASQAPAVAYCTDLVGEVQTTDNSPVGDMSAKRKVMVCVLAHVGKL
jgi:hypothetical protein